MPKPRMPALSHGFVSAIWAFALGLYIWIGGMAVGWSRTISFVLAVVAGFAIYYLVRVYGEDEPPKPESRRP